MALMFTRSANNFAKNGYFPTDDATLATVCELLHASPSGEPLRILDPCCGEGYALATIQHKLLHNDAYDEGDVEIDSYGIEFDSARAYEAKGMLGQVAHADVNDVIVAPRSIGCLFLNPPYGDLVSDKANLSEDAKVGRQRLEKMFFDKTINWLQYGGILILIVPYYTLDEDFALRIAKNFDRAPEQQFKRR